MSFLDDMLNPKQNKEANLIPQGENREDHFDRKVAASNWIAEVSELDPVKVEAEYLAAQAAEARALGKTAAHEFKTDEEVITEDYKRDAKSLSDYALAEMLAELRCSKEQNTQEMFHEEKEKAKKEVASSREKAEKALLDLIPDHTHLDWKKAFEKFSKDEAVAEVKEKDLYQPIAPEKAHDFENPTEEKFKVPSDKEKPEIMVGVGREADERTDVTAEAGVLQEKYTEGLGKVAAKTENLAMPEGKKSAGDAAVESVEEPTAGDSKKTVGDKDEQAAEANSPEKGDKAKLEEAVQKEADKKEHTEDCMDANDDTSVLKGKCICPSEKKASESCEKCKETYKNPEAYCFHDEQKPVVEKKADYEGWVNQETWAVALWLDNDRGLYEAVQEAKASIADAGQFSQWLQTFVEEQKPDLGANLWGDMLDHALANVKWYDIAEHEMGKEASAGMPAVEKKSEPTSPLKREELPMAKKADNCPVCGGEGSDLANGEEDHIACMDCGASYGSKKVSEEIKSHASKADVIKKVAELSKKAEIDSPWIVTKDEQGNEVIARRDMAELNKVSEETNQDLQK